MALKNRSGSIKQLPVNVTDAQIVNKPYRNYRRAVTLLASLERRRSWLYNKDLLSPSSEKRFQNVSIDLKEFISIGRLDSNAFIADTYIPAIIRMPVKRAQDYVFPDAPEIGPAAMTTFDKEIAHHMSEKGRKARSARHSFDLMAEIAYRTHHGWFILFNTLTVNPESYTQVFSREGTSWKSYIERMDAIFAQASFGSVRNAKGQDYHSYFAVVEEGGQFGRLHIHVLHLFSHLPLNWSDPNIGRNIPDRREISAVRGLWPHGFSSPIAVRYSPSDAFGRSHWRWPIDRRTQQGLLAKSPLATAGYMTKYVTKSYVSPKRRTYLWRVRKSRLLGRQILKEILSPLSIKTLMIISTQQTFRPRINNGEIPPSLLRQEALLRLQDLSSSISLSELIIDASPQQSLLQRSRALIQTKQPSSSPSITSIVTPAFPSEDISEAHEQLRLSILSVERQFYKPSAKLSKSVTVRYTG